MKIFLNSEIPKHKNLSKSTIICAKLRVICSTLLSKIIAICSLDFGSLNFLRVNLKIQGLISYSLFLIMIFRISLVFRTVNPYISSLNIKFKILWSPWELEFRSVKLLPFIIYILDPQISYWFKKIYLNSEYSAASSLYRGLIK